MLQEVLEHIHNRFIRQPHVGEYTVTGSMLSPSAFLREGQRFWLFGSIQNDGLYTYHATGCTNDDDNEEAQFVTETFGGTICDLEVPKRLISLSREIEEWVEKYGEILNNPYSSESFGGYSYQKSQMSKSYGQNPFIGWQDVFGRKLERWRKICW